MQYIGSSITQENVLVALERADKLRLKPLKVGALPLRALVFRSKTGASCRKTVIRACKARLHLRFLMRSLAPRTGAFFVKHRMDWKDNYHIFVEDTPLSDLY